MVHGEGEGVSLLKGYDFRSGLHARTLFGDDELPSFEFFSRPREERCNLNRESMFSVQVLVKAVVVSRPILQEKRRRPLLPGSMTPMEELLMRLRVSDVDGHELIPAIRNRH